MIDHPQIREAIHSEALWNTAKPPKQIRCLGNAQLLEKQGVAIVGSRDAEPTSIRAAREIAFQLAAHDLNVVSGYARGVDLTAHMGALMAGGTTTLVLPDGINQFRTRDRQLRRFWSWRRALILSEFEDEEPFQAVNAFARNGTICDLAAAVVIVCADQRSGTMNTAQQALRRGLPVFVVVDSFSRRLGNLDLLERGATPLYTHDLTHAVDVLPVLTRLGIRPRLWSYEVCCGSAPSREASRGSINWIYHVCSQVVPYCWIQQQPYHFSSWGPLSEEKQTHRIRDWKDWLGIPQLRKAKLSGVPQPRLPGDVLSDLSF
jgi:DNA processing protein